VEEKPDLPILKRAGCGQDAEFVVVAVRNDADQI